MPFYPGFELKEPTLKDIRKQMAYYNVVVGKRTWRYARILVYQVRFPVLIVDWKCQSSLGIEAISVTSTIGYVLSVTPSHHAIASGTLMRQKVKGCIAFVSKQRDELSSPTYCSSQPKDALEAANHVLQSTHSPQT